MSKHLKDEITGPVFPILPAFSAQGAFDEAATAQYVRYLVENGAKVLMVTAGTSRLNLMSIEEIKKLNAIVAQNKGADGIAIAANPDYGSLEVSKDIAQAAQSDGADAFLLYYSERYYDDETTVAFYTAIAESCTLPLMIHAMPMRGASTGPTVVHAYDMKLVGKLAQLPAIIGMKEENGNEGLRQQLLLEFSERLAFVVAGGGMGKFLTARALGAQAYLTGLGNINPKLALEFYTACIEGDDTRARAMVRDLEQPFFNEAVPMGWHVALKGALHIAGLMPVHERLPLRAPSEAQIEVLTSIMTKLKIGAA